MSGRHPTLRPRAPGKASRTPARLRSPGRVPVQVERGRDVRVPHEGRRRLRVPPGGDHRRRVRVPRAVLRQPTEAEVLASEAARLASCARPLPRLPVVDARDVRRGGAHDRTGRASGSARTCRRRSRVHATRSSLPLSGSGSSLSSSSGDRHRKVVVVRSDSPIESSAQSSFSKLGFGAITGCILRSGRCSHAGGSTEIRRWFTSTSCCCAASFSAPSMSTTLAVPYFSSGGSG